MVKIVSTLLVMVHPGAAFWHGDGHTDLGVELSAKQTLLIYVVIIVAPLLATILIWTRCMLLGLWIFFLSMPGSFLFGACYHYVFVSSDNIRHLPAGTPESHSHFITSAAVIALVELA